MTFIIIPFFILTIFIFAYISKINAYQSFINGAKEGMKMSVKIFPFVLSMIFATSILKASNIVQDIFRHVNSGVPFELIMQGVFRPISGNAAMAIMMDIFSTYGVDSSVGIASSILEGSSDTTIYIITLYFGSVGVIKYRYALKVGLIADMIGLILTIILFI